MTDTVSISLLGLSGIEYVACGVKGIKGRQQGPVDAILYQSFPRRSNQGADWDRGQLQRLALAAMPQRLKRLGAATQGDPLAVVVASGRWRFWVGSGSAGTPALLLRNLRWMRESVLVLCRV